MKEKIKSKIYLENSQGKLKLLFFNPKIVVKDSEHEGRLMDGRPLVMSVINEEEVWYIPYKYQKG